MMLGQDEFGTKDIPNTGLQPYRCANSRTENSACHSHSLYCAWSPYHLHAVGKRGVRWKALVSRAM
jgi:hypothetical protein